MNLEERLRRDQKARECFVYLHRAGYDHTDFNEAIAVLHKMKALGDEPFILNQQAVMGGGSGSGDVSLAPARMVEVFGEPLDGVDSSTGEYKFVDTDGGVYCVADHKATTAYDPEAKYRPSELWETHDLILFVIWTNSGKKSSELATWLQEKTKKEAA